jgi:hypothetical protein
VFGSGFERQAEVSGPEWEVVLDELEGITQDCCAEVALDDCNIAQDNGGRRSNPRTLHSGQASTTAGTTQGCNVAYS